MKNVPKKLVLHSIYESFKIILKLTSHLHIVRIHICIQRWLKC